jgi:catechol 2,3-dioxygenase-like lactoylglutathione lyase family enzyme
MKMTVLGVNHIGIPIRDLDATVEWYRDKLGLEPTFGDSGTTGPDVARLVQVEGAVIDMAFYVLGNTCVEFLEYTQPVGAEFTLRNCDVGAVHICFQVDDVQGMYEDLVAKGVEFNAPPSLIEEGPMAGITVAYFRDLHGIQLEFFQVPHDSPAQARGEV